MRFLSILDSCLVNFFIIVREDNPKEIQAELISTGNKGNLAWKHNSEYKKQERRIQKFP